METKNGKVVSANFKKEWSGQYGTMFDHDVEFADGTKGVYTSKKKDQDTFKVGAELPYTLEVKERNGYKNNVIKPVSENKGGFGGKTFAPKNYKADFISFAASYSKDLVVAGKAEIKDFRKIFSTMYDVMAEKLDEVNKASANRKSVV